MPEACLQPGTIVEVESGAIDSIDGSKNEGLSVTESICPQARPASAVAGDRQNVHEDEAKAGLTR
jgi:hypothetical protein